MADHLIIEPLPLDDEAMYQEFEDKTFANGNSKTILELGTTKNEQLIILRNDTIDKYLALSDVKYGDFKTFTSAENSTFETLIGISSVGITTAATLAGGPMATTLAATDTALKGAHATVNEKWIQNKTVSAIIAAIDTVRNEIQQKIEKGKKQKYLDYTMREAIGDINKRHNAASIINGLLYLESISKNQQAASQQTLEKEKSSDDKDTANSKQDITAALDSAANSSLSSAKQAIDKLATVANAPKASTKTILIEAKKVIKAAEDAQAAVELSNAVNANKEMENISNNIGSGGITP